MSIKRIEFSFTELPPGFVTELENIWCCVADEITFQCRVTKAKYPVVWSLNGEEMNEKQLQSRFAVAIDDTNRTLKISNAMLSDNGRVTAVCVDQEISASIEVVPVGIERPPEDARVREGEIAVFKCTSNKDGAKVK